MNPSAGKASKRKPPTKNDKQANKDPVELFCRLTPLSNPNEVGVIKILDNKIVELDQLDSATTKGPRNQLQYTFKHVFDVDALQKDVFKHVALPLVSDLIRGNPGLLFTYEMTSPGKTYSYTMIGDPQDAGILPRSLDVIFNCIGNFQAHKYVFKPDKLKGFNAQPWVEAVLEYQWETLGQASKPSEVRRKDDGVVDWTSRTCETEKVDDADPAMAYAVFVSYIEMYNNCIYDLLDDTPTDLITKQLQTRILWEDSKRCMYAFGVTEVEAKTADEALDVYCRGQKKKRGTHTALNAESSLSHSIFNIRLVQAPLDADGPEILPDKNFITISQLSLVDLAGSERTLRTGCTGSRHSEAANINNSLMRFRTCIEEILRENQTADSNKIVRCRDTDLTHLFKSFFDREGKVKMIVCVNPCADDYDETLHVMKFAEMAQEVLLPRATRSSSPLSALCSIRRRKEGVIRTERLGARLKDLVSQPLTNSVLEPVLPNYVLTMPSDEEVLPRLMEYLTQRISLRKSREEAMQQRREELRKNILEMESERNILKEQQKALRMELKAREQHVVTLEKELSNSVSATQAANLELEELRRQKRTLENQLREKEMLLSQGAMEKVHMQNEMEGCIALERQRMKRVMDRLLAEKQAELESKVCMTQEKFRLLKEIFNAVDWDLLDGHAGNANRDEERTESRVTRAQSRPSYGTSEMFLSTTLSKLRICSDENSKDIPVCNPRHRRSKSSDGELWVDHRPPGNVEMGTVMQPVMKNRKSVGKLDLKDVTNRASKYVLTHQEQDASGCIETHLYKGDVIPSIGGGAQVVFNDVETVTQVSPISGRLRW